MLAVSASRLFLRPPSSSHGWSSITRISSSSCQGWNRIASCSRGWPRSSECQSTSLPPVPHCPPRRRPLLLSQARILLSTTSSNFQQTEQPKDTSKSGAQESAAPVQRDRILTVPNLLCLSRIALSPYLAHLVAHDRFHLALAVFAYAGLTDMADGYIARNFEGQASMLGSFLDPLADKILVATLFLSLTYVNIIPAALTSLVVSRDVLLVYAGMYIRYMGVPKPFTFSKYFDASAPLAQVQPTTISKVNTVVQLVLVGAAIAAPIAGMEQHPAFHGLCLLTACTTFASAVSYAFMRDTYKFSHRSYDHQFGKKLSAFAFFIAFNLAFVYYFPVQQGGGETGKNGER